MKEKNIRPMEAHQRYAELYKQDIEKYFTDTKKFIEFKRCINCGSMENIEKLKGKFIFYSCKCGTLFLNPRPSYGILEHYYKNAESIKYFVSNIRDKTEKNRIKNIFIPRLNLLEEFMGSNFKEMKSLLDIGSGSGAFLKVVRENTKIKNLIGNEIISISIDKMTKAGFKVLPGAIEKTNINMRVDIITAFEVIAHVPVPLDFLKKCYKLLNKNGYLFLTTPNFNSLEYGLFYDKKGIEDNPAQMNFFNFDSIDIIFEKAGFKILSKVTPGELDIDIIFKKWKEKPETVKNEFINSLFEYGDCHLINKFQNFIREYNLSSHMAILAQKKR